MIVMTAILRILNWHLQLQLQLQLHGIRQWSQPAAHTDMLLGTRPKAQGQTRQIAT